MRENWPGLEIDDNSRFQQKEWRVQRIGIVVLALLVVAALLGLTGMGGPLNRGEAGRPDQPVFLQFERFVRSGATSTVTLHLKSVPGVVKFWVSTSYFKHVRIVSVAPDPQAVSADEDRRVFTVQSESAHVAITLVMEHFASGKIDATMGLVDGPSVRFTQWALF